MTKLLEIGPVALFNLRLAAQLSRNLLGAEQFRTLINVFVDAHCAVCDKLLYPQQRVNLATATYSSVLPPELISVDRIMTC